MPDIQYSVEPWASVQRAFSKQAEHFDQDDIGNPILDAWRKRIYAHVERFMKKESSILEINAGTGIDALYFVAQGHQVHATDISAGMVNKIREKVSRTGVHASLTVQQCSFEALDGVDERKFDYVFSNFGGLNCSRDLGNVSRHLPRLLNDQAFLTWVIMPPVSLWEWSWILKGRKAAFRRLGNEGAAAHLEGELFQTYYHSLKTIRGKLGNHFQLVRVEGLGSISPPPASFEFVKRHAGTYSLLKKLDESLGSQFPFNRCADHIIATFQYTA